MYQKQSKTGKPLRRQRRQQAEDGAVLARFLNISTGRTHERFLRMVDVVATITRMTEEQPESIPTWEKIEVPSTDGKSTVIIPAKTDSEWEGFQLLKEANFLLSRYRAPVVLRAPTPAHLRLQATYPAETNEALAALALVRLAGQGWSVLSLLRQCKGCEEWFFAGRPNKTSCLAGCRHRKYARTDSGKKRVSLLAKITYWSNEIERALSPKRRTLARKRKQAAEQELTALNDSRESVPADTALTRRKPTATPKT